MRIVDAGVELQAANGPIHAHFYGESRYGNTPNFVMKIEWFPEDGTVERHKAALLLRAGRL